MFAAARIPYKSTHSFTSIITDYLDGAQTLQPFYTAAPSLENIASVIALKRQQPLNRNVLVEALRNQYQAVETDAKVQAAIESLLSENTFTVCTAHQPN